MGVVRRKGLEGKKIRTDKSRVKEGGQHGGKKPLLILYLKRGVEERKVDTENMRIRFCLIDAMAEMLDNGKHHERWNSK